MMLPGKLLSSKEISNTIAGMNNHALLVKLKKEEIKNYNIRLVCAGLGGVFNCTGKVHVMKKEELINEPDGKAWKK